MSSGKGLTDLSHSTAFSILDSLVSQGRLDQDKAGRLKDQYSRMHSGVLEVYDHEKVLLKEAKRLQQELADQQISLDKAQHLSFEDNTQIGQLRRELLKGENELALAQEKENGLSVTQEDLVRHQQELQKEVDELHRMQEEMFEPQIQSLQQTIEEIRADQEQQKNVLDKLYKEKKDAHEVLDKLQQRRIESEADKNSLRIQKAKSMKKPEQIKKTADVVHLQVQGVQSDLSRMQQQLSSLQDELLGQGRSRKESEDEQMALALRLEKHRNDIEAKEREGDTIVKNLELAKEEANNSLADRVKHELELRTVLQDERKQKELLSRRTRERDHALRGMRRAEFALNNALSSIPDLKHQLEDATHTLETIKGDKKRSASELEVLVQDVDMSIASYLKQEMGEKSQKEALVNLTGATRELEVQVLRLAEQEHDLNREIAELSTARQMKAREAANATTRYRSILEEVKMRDLLIADLQKSMGESVSHQEGYAKMYDVVKNERNRYVNLIQAASQATAEMKEKLKILSNEVDILRNDSMTKDRALARERLNHQNAFKARDNLRNEVNRRLFTYRKKQEGVDQQITEIDKLNAIINNTEEDMFRMKQRYEASVEDRNATGISLIDRNDELCILYEKSNIQEGVLKKGQDALVEKDNEAAMMKRAVADLNRERELLKRAIPRKDELEKEKLSMTEQLMSERKLTALLSGKLENPENADRWRKLGGADMAPEELAMQLQSLEERLNDKREQLLEKELVLEEISGLANKLRERASTGRSDTLELSRKVNDVQARIRAVTRKMMATVSELSMYQATSMTLQQEKYKKEAALEEADRRLERGEAPTEEAEKDWSRWLQQRELARERAAGLGEEDLEELAGLMERVRPSAYVPDDDELGLPVPYGSKAPFKPSMKGASMRHYRKPVEKPIILD